MREKWRVLVVGLLTGLLGGCATAGAVEEGAAQRSTAEQEAGLPNEGMPGTGQPGAEQPGTGQPGTGGSGAGRLGAGQPGAAGQGGVGQSAPGAAGDAAVSTEEGPERIGYPAGGGGQWWVVGGRSGVAGRSGRLLRYRVAVEKDISGVDVDRFGARVSEILADPRGWTAGGGWRLQRVGPGEQRDFTIYLATPATRDRLCDMGYDRYTSCRNGNNVVLNVARWAHAVPHYDLDVYRAYMVNHEAGHRLGHGHEKCPRRGEPAPVMQQQTLGLHGCTANPWPYLSGRRYSGPSGQYGDPVPAEQ